MYANFQQNATAQQPEMTWNGTSWVPSTTLHTAHTTSSYETSLNGKSNLVQLYTEYYHAYTEQAQRWEPHLQSPDPKIRSDADQQYRWAKYQADESSRAAHFFHQNPGATSAPFDLPPPPAHYTEVNHSNNVLLSHNQHFASAPQQPSCVAVSGGQDDSPASLKVFVHRCLLPCKTQTEKDEVMEQVQKLIQEAIMSNNLHIKDWSQVPSVRPRATAPSLQQQQSVFTGPVYRQASQNSSSHSYYGPTSSPETANISHFATQHQSVTKRNNAPSHYGPWDSSETYPSSHAKKKRKENGFDQSTLALKSREKRFVGPGGIGEASSSSWSAVEGFGRFMGKETIGGKTGKLTEEDFEKMTVKGTCLKLEKEYLRLTAPPRPELVRPEAVLRQHLENMKQERLRPSRRDYIWFCSQLKAIRQDCTVQRIQNSFTIDVYETHARIALEENDLNEYNQCQTQLKELYRTVQGDTEATKNIREFLAYRLLYYVFLMGNKKYTGGSSDLFHLMLSLSPSEKEDPAIHHALLVRGAVAELNYHLFFRLRLSCPNLGAFLMDHIAPTMRFNGLQRICRAYRPAVEVEFVAQELGFGEHIEQCRSYLQSCSCLLLEDGVCINTKDTVLSESDLEQKDSLI
jgi:hypothetical protein